jgi:DNA gyrase/topoisomerase IV subunit B|tara:strand:+ start:114 stop:500 length:387 start_codon:yes stop_codon:yes gene_type:complete
VLFPIRVSLFSIGKVLITLEDRRKNRKRIVEFCQQEGVTRVIIDGRDQESKTSITETFSFGAEVPEEMRGIAVAIVYRPGDQALPFIDTVAANRGSTTKSFLFMEEARAWLEAQEESRDKTLDPGRPD